MVKLICMKKLKMLFCHGERFWHTFQNLCNEQVFIRVILCIYRSKYHLKQELYKYCLGITAVAEKKTCNFLTPYQTTFFTNEISFSMFCHFIAGYEFSKYTKKFSSVTEMTAILHLISCFEISPAPI